MSSWLDTVMAGSLVCENAKVSWGLSFRKIGFRVPAGVIYRT